MLSNISNRIRSARDRISNLRNARSSPASGNPLRLRSWSTGVVLETVDAETAATRSIITKCTGTTAQSDYEPNAVSVTRDFQKVLPFNIDDYGGTVTPGDCVFIASMIGSIRPRSIVEIGVAFGYSSAFVLFCLEKYGLLKEGSALESFDIEEGKPWWSQAGTRWSERTIGELVGVAVPELNDHWTLRTRCTSADMATADGQISRNGVPALGMIDAAHWHPWPLIDLLALCHVLPSGSWIMMQDVSLSTRLLVGCVEWGGDALFSHYGAQIVFEHWPFEKFRGVGGCYNMAAVRIPEDKGLIGEAMRPLLNYPYESEIGPKETAFLDKLLG
jgi:hypothetical protein